MLCATFISRDETGDDQSSRLPVHLQHFSLAFAQSTNYIILHPDTACKKTTDPWFPDYSPLSQVASAKHLHYGPSRLVKECLVAVDPAAADWPITDIEPGGSLRQMWRKEQYKNKQLDIFDK